MVKEFADQNLLKFTVSKCEIVIFSTQPATTLAVCEVNGSVMPVMQVVLANACLAYWWKGDLSASRFVENIQKARRAFLHFGNMFLHSWKRRFIYLRGLRVYSVALFHCFLPCHVLTKCDNSNFP